jgi:hypothetical protein
MWRRVDLVWADVSEERSASIFRVENPRARNQCEQVAADFSVLKMDKRFPTPSNVINKIVNF